MTERGNDPCALAQAAMRAGRWAEAEQHLETAVARNPADHFAYAMAGELRVAQKRIQDAALLYAQSIAHHPDALQYKERFAALAGVVLAAEWNPQLAAAVRQCLNTAAVDCSRLSAFWYSLVRLEPRAKSAFDLTKSPDMRALASPLFLDGLKRVIVYDATLERFLVHLRGSLLRALAQRGDRRAVTEIAAAVAHYAFNVDYILDVSADENEAVRALRAAVESGVENDAAATAVLACYVPLHELGNASAIQKQHSGSSALGPVVRLQISEALRLRREREDISQLTPVASGVSHEVQGQYEAFPYPRWDSVSPRKLVSDWEAQATSREHEGMLLGAAARILIAGCGTGREAASLAAVFPDAKITAIDLSRTSLAYARSKAREYGFSNVEFHQADILGLSEWSERFDYVSAAGVLHHMGDPARGLQICAGLLKPGGLMRIALYSEIARSAIVAARDAIAKRGYSDDADGMRQFRRDAPSILPAEVVQELMRYLDYFQLSMCRDLLFHVQEHRFTLPGIAELLERSGLGLSGFYLPEGVLAAYTAAFPMDHDRTDLSNWDRFERDHPETFRNMYVFWCKRTEPPQ